MACRSWLDAKGAPQLGEVWALEKERELRRKLLQLCSRKKTTKKTLPTKVPRKEEASDWAIGHVSYFGTEGERQCQENSVDHSELNGRLE